MLSGGCISVDIGKKNIKIVYGKNIGQKIEIINFDIIKTPENSVQDGKIVDLPAIINCLRVSIKSKNITSRNLKLIVSGTNVITRDIKIPKVDEKEIDKILEYEAPQYFPVSLENYVMDYKIIEEIEEEGSFYRILLVAVPEVQVEEYMQIPKILKLDIKSVDISANSIFKYMTFGDKSKEDNDTSEYAVIDFGAYTTAVCIFSKGTLMFNRILLKGGKEIDDTIANSMNIDYEIAENLKCRKLLLIDDENKADNKYEKDIIQLSEIAKPAIIRQADDINRFLNFYNSRMYGNKISKIYICGGGSKIRGLNEFLSSYMNIPVEYIKYKEKLIIKNKRIKELLDEKFPYLINAIGTIL